MTVDLFGHEKSFFDIIQLVLELVGNKKLDVYAKALFIINFGDNSIIIIIKYIRQSWEHSPSDMQTNVQIDSHTPDSLKRGGHVLIEVSWKYIRIPFPIIILLIPIHRVQFRVAAAAAFPAISKFTLNNILFTPTHTQILRMLTAVLWLFFFPCCRVLWLGEHFHQPHP